MRLTVGSLFSGCGGLELGFDHVGGFDLRWQVEIDKDCIKVLTHHWPDVRRVRDINSVAYGRSANRRKHGLMLEPVDIVTAGVPCQDVSVAGKRAGLAGSRTGLFFAFARMLRLLKPKVMVFENVSGLLSQFRGRDFFTVIQTLRDCGYLDGAYRVLNSRYFGVAQRRRRVFLVAYRGDGERARSVLFEPASGDGNSQAGNEARADVAATLRGRSHGAGVNEPGRGGEDDQNLIAYTLVTNERNKSQGPDNYITGPLGGGNDGIGRRSEDDPNLVFDVHANQRGEVRTSLLAGTLNQSRSGKQYEGVMLFAPSALTAGNTRHPQNENQPLVVSRALSSPRSGMRFDPNGEDYVVGALGTGHFPRGHGFKGVSVQETKQGQLRATPAGVRRLTPLECERLQAFPDFWTCLCGATTTADCTCADSPRYRMLGNAVTVSVAEWIGHRILAAEGARRLRGE